MGKINTNTKTPPHSRTQPTPVGLTDHDQLSEQHEATPRHAKD